MIDESGPCPRPEILTEGQIKLALADRNLSSNGTRSELNSRLLQYNHGNCCQFSDLYEMVHPHCKHGTSSFLVILSYKYFKNIQMYDMYSLY